MPRKLPRLSAIKTSHGTVFIKRCKDSNYLITARLELTFQRDDDPNVIMSLEQEYYVDHRRDLTSSWVREKTDKLLEHRTDLDGLTLRTVWVKVDKTVWLTPRRTKVKT